MTANEAFYKAYELTGHSFPAKRLPVTDYYINIVEQSDKRKAEFLRLITMELVPDDLCPGGDYNTPRIEAALKRFDVNTLPEIQNGSGDFMLGVLYARQILRFPNRDEDYEELQKALACFKRAKEKGCLAAQNEIDYYSQWVE